MINLDDEINKLQAELDSYIRCGRNLTGSSWVDYRKRCIEPLEKRIAQIKQCVDEGTIKQYFVVGGVCGLENHFKVVNATSVQFAEAKFEKYVRDIEGDDDRELHIKHCQTFDEMHKKSIY